MRIQAARDATIPAPTAHTSATVAMRTMTGSTSRWRAMPPQTPPSMRSSRERVIRRGVVFSVVVVGESFRVCMSAWSPPRRPRTIGNRPYVPSPGEPWGRRRLQRDGGPGDARTGPRGGAHRAVERGDEHVAQAVAVEAAALEPVEARGLDKADPAADRDPQRGRGLAPFAAAGQVLEQPRDHDAADALDDVGHRGVAADPGAQDGRVAAGVRLDVLEVALEGGGEAGARLERRVGLGERLHLVGRRADDRHIEVALAREVVVEQALRDPRGRGDVVDRDLVERPLAEDLDAERDQLLVAGAGAQKGAAGGHARRSVSRATAASRGGSARRSAPATRASQTATIAARAA